MSSCEFCGTHTGTHWPDCPHSIAYHERPEPAHEALDRYCRQALEPFGLATSARQRELAEHLGSQAACWLGQRASASPSNGAVYSASFAPDLQRYCERLLADFGSTLATAANQRALARYLARAALQWIASQPDEQDAQTPSTDRAADRRGLGGGC